MPTFALIMSEDGSLDLDLYCSRVEAVRAARAWAVGIYSYALLPETDDAETLTDALMEEDLPLDFSVVELETTREEKITDIVDAYIAKYQITCPETVFQTDRIVLSALELIEALCDAAGYHQIDETQNGPAPPTS